MKFLDPSPVLFVEKLGKLNNKVGKRNVCFGNNIKKLLFIYSSTCNLFIFLMFFNRYKEAVPITNPELLSKIHQTNRVQYIYDVVFPAPCLYEDNVLSALTSFLFFNRVEIVTLIQVIIDR